ncbi:MAG: hypothetical protein M3N43_03930 [Actinomycetota bacterium]|nr:hypothetical protein [Actinomycetota bacterium]
MLSGFSDVFVAQLNAAGSALVYATDLGGSSQDEGRGIAMDAAGAAYVTGVTCSRDVPITPGAFQTTSRGGDCSGIPCDDTCVAKLTADGSALLSATYLSGSSVDEGTGIAVDASGAAYETGFTCSSDFPTMQPRPPAYAGGGDAFVAKLNAAGSTLVYATDLGGGGFDHSTGLAVDATNAAYVTGQTGSSDFPTVQAVQPTLNGPNGGEVPEDAFIAKLTANGSSLIYATDLGGHSFDEGRGIAVDATGHASVTGATRSPDFPTVQAVQPTLGGGCQPGPFGLFCDEDALVAKLSSPALAGTPGRPNCHGQRVSALARQFGGLEAAAAALGFPSVQARQDAIREFGEG